MNVRQSVGVQAPGHSLLWVVLLLLSLAAGGAACSDNPLPPGSTATNNATNNATANATNNGTIDADTGEDDVQMDTTDQPDVPPMDVDVPDVAPDVASDVRPDAPDTTPDVNQPDVDREVVPTLVDLSPARGAVEGGTEVLFIGHDFTDDTAVFIGSHRVQGLERLSSEQMIGRTPPGPLGLADVKVLNGLGESLLSGAWTYFASLRIDGVSPGRSPVQGGELVRLTGAGFDADTQVSVAGRAVIGLQMISTEELEFVTPPAAVGRQDVRVIGRNSSALLANGMRYYQPLTLDAVFPASGPAAGGNLVTAIGAGFDGEVDVQLGDLTVRAELISDTEVRFEAPAGAPGFANVTARNGNGVSGIVNGYYYEAAPSQGLSLRALAPTSGSTGGGTVVTIIGGGLDGAGLTVTLDGAPVEVSRVSGTTLIGTTPPGTAGPADLVVRTDAGEARLPGVFTYVEALTIGSVSPDNGPVAGGTEVTITGTRFTEETAVYIGPLRATVTSVAADRIVVESPPGSVGRVDVRVEDGQQSATLEDGYRYTQQIEVWGLQPTRGSISGGTFVVVRGRGFSTVPTVRFGQDEATEVELLDASTVTCRAPAHREGPVDVTLTFGDESLRSPERYTFFNPGTIFGGVWGDAIHGAVNVSVFEYSGAPVANAFVMLTVSPTTPYRGFTNDRGQVTFSGPDLTGQQTVTAVAANYSSATVQSFNAENVTVFLVTPPQGSGGGGGAPLGRITGLITGVDKVADAGPDEFELAIVYTTRPSLFEPSPPTGNGNVVLGNGEYTLQSRVGDVAVVGVAGLYNNRTDVFTPYYMGVRRGLFVEQEQTYIVDLEMDIPLNNAITFKLRDAPRGPSGPNMNEVLPYLDFGYEGVFLGQDTAAGDGEFVTAFHQPHLVEELSDVTFIFLGGAWTDGGGPYSLSILRDVTNTTGVVEMPQLLGVPMALNPEEGGRAVNRYVELDPGGLEEPDFYYINIEKLDETLVWNIILPGNEPYFQLPEFPDFSALPPEERPNPLLGGQLVMNVVTARAYSFDYDSFDFNDFGLSQWESFTSTSWIIRLR